MPLIWLRQTAQPHTRYTAVYFANHPCIVVSISCVQQREIDISAAAATDETTINVVSY